MMTECLTFMKLILMQVLKRLENVWKNTAFAIDILDPIQEMYTIFDTSWIL